MVCLRSADLFGRAVVYKGEMWFHGFMELCFAQGYKG